MQGDRKFFSIAASHGQNPLKIAQKRKKQDDRPDSCKEVVLFISDRLSLKSISSAFSPIRIVLAFAIVYR
ncbi:MAG: hypothetical protein AAGA60_11715 [Cyanobacteria bacterium P01_E01_bin.42]